MASENHALVFGASGVSGWGIMHELVSYPTSTTWTSIIGATNRPLSPAEAHLPDDLRISLVSGIDLTAGVPEVARLLREKVKNIEKITHVFFTAYIHVTERTFALIKEHGLGGAVAEPPQYGTPDYHKLVTESNVAIVKNATGALNEVAPNLQFFVMQTGGKHYGMDSGPQAVPSLLNSPYEEERPRLTGDLAKPVFYYGQIDAMEEASKGKSWKFSETRPDVIVGFVPSLGSVSGQDGARVVALYLSLYRKIHGEGAECSFPGTQRSWTNSHTDSWQDTIAKVSIWTALNDYAGPFNCVDQPTTWKEKWPAICDFFGLKGDGPKAKPIEMMEPIQWVHGHKKEVEELIEENGLIGDSWTNANWLFFWAILVVLDYDKEYDMKKATGLGFKDQASGAKGWLESFKRLREAKIIP
jgi:hypothetical protein